MTQPGKDSSLAVVTGAFSYTGKYIARRLLEQGIAVKTLTGHPNRSDPFGGRVTTAPLDFSNPGRLARSLEGAQVLFNTYWVRFPRGQTTFERAVENSTILFQAAKQAGVGRIVHVSITNASSRSGLGYFRGKGQVEENLEALGVPHTILRPALVFGDEDILLNNMAWALRRFPVFPLPGRGGYPVRPVYVDDLAALAVGSAFSSGNAVVDAVEPETYTFEALLRLLTETLGVPTRLAPTPPPLALNMTRLIGLFTRDVVLTRDEIEGLTAGLLDSDAPPTGETSLRTWIQDNAETLGRTYASEVDRHYRP